VKAIAKVRGVSFHAVASMTTLNAVRRFGSALEHLVRYALIPDGSS